MAAEARIALGARYLAYGGARDDAGQDGDRGRNPERDGVLRREGSVRTSDHLEEADVLASRSAAASRSPAQFGVLRHADAPNAPSAEATARARRRPADEAIDHGGDDPAGVLGGLEHDAGAGVQLRDDLSHGVLGEPIGSIEIPGQVDDHADRVVLAGLGLADHQVTGVGARMPMHPAPSVTVLVRANAPQVPRQGGARRPLTFVGDECPAQLRTLLARLRGDIEGTGELGARGRATTRAGLEGAAVATRTVTVETTPLRGGTMARRPGIFPASNKGLPPTDRGVQRIDRFATTSSSTTEPATASVGE